MNKKKKVSNPLARFFSASFAVILALASVGSVYAEVSDTELSVEKDTAEETSDTEQTADNEGTDETDTEVPSDVLSDPAAADPEQEQNADGNGKTGNTDGTVSAETGTVTEETKEEPEPSLGKIK